MISTEAHIEHALRTGSGLEDDDLMFILRCQKHTMERFGIELGRGTLSAALFIIEAWYSMPPNVHPTARGFVFARFCDPNFLRRVTCELFSEIQEFRS